MRDRVSAPVYVSGWMNRVLPDSELTPETKPQYQVYAEQGIWFDAVNHLARLHLANPSGPGLSQEWQRLLQAEGVDLGQLTNTPLAGQVQFMPTQFMPTSDIVAD